MKQNSGLLSLIFRKATRYAENVKPNTLFLFLYLSLLRLLHCLQSI